MNLQDIKQERGLKNRDIARALSCSTSKAGMILQGRHIHVYHDEDIEQLATILGITFERCWYAMCESYNQWRGTPGAIHERADEVRAEVQAELQGRVPDLPIEVQAPRQMTTIESSLVVPEERRIAVVREALREAQ
jgi:hypothetical protein